MDEVTERMRHECEARHWLRQGYTTPKLVAELQARIAAKRGEDAAEALVQEMRRQWKRRAEWMGAAA